MKRKPNILFLMTDEHRYDLLGFTGNKIVRTPNLDYLAKDAVVFNNCYTPYPQCVPARQAMASGKLPLNCGCPDFDSDLTPGYRTFARTFTEHAYQTICCGKLHHKGLDQMQGWSRRIGSEMQISGAFIPGLDRELLKAYRTPRSELRWDNRKEILRAGVGRARQLIEDDYTTLGALNCIEEVLESPYYDKQQLNQPIFLMLSLVLPHYPFQCDEKLFKYYLNRVPIYGKDEILSQHPWLQTKHVEIGKDVTERDVRRATAAYYGMVETADRNIGIVLEKLKEANQDIDDWIVIFTSDHGDMLGQHGIWAKHKFYEGSAKVPLFIRFPQKFKHRTVNNNVNLIDLYPTLCEIADLPYPDDLDGRSLLPLLNGDDSNWLNETVSQYKGGHVMIKRDELKYQYYGENMPEVLFDLENDPDENINYINDKSYRGAVEILRRRAEEIGFSIK